jgi:hypothetical protein
MHSFLNQVTNEEKRMHSFLNSRCFDIANHYVVLEAKCVGNWKSESY